MKQIKDKKIKDTLRKHFRAIFEKPTGRFTQFEQTQEGIEFVFAGEKKNISLAELLTYLCEIIRLLQSDPDYLHKQETIEESFYEATIQLFIDEETSYSAFKFPEPTKNLINLKLDLIVANFAARNKAKLSEKDKVELVDKTAKLLINKNN